MVGSPGQEPTRHPETDRGSQDRCCADDSGRDAELGRREPLSRQLHGASELYTWSQDGDADQRHVEEGCEDKHRPAQVGTPGSAVLPAPTERARVEGKHNAEPGGNRKNTDRQQGNTKCSNT